MIWAMATLVAMVSSIFLHRISTAWQRKVCVFTQAYAGAPVSAPSRACFMTGQHSGHTEVRGNKELLGSEQTYLLWEKPRFQRCWATSLRPRTCYPTRDNERQRLSDGYVR